MEAVCFRERAKQGDVKMDVETYRLTSEQEDKIKALFTEFANSVKKELGE